MNNTPKMQIPGPRGDLLLGSIPDIRRDRVQFLLDLRRDYGDVVKIRLGPASGIAIFHPDDLKRIMQDNQSNYSKETHTLNLLKPLVGNGLIRSDGELWLRQRRMMQPAFHRDTINRLSEMIVRQTQAMLDPLEAAAHSGQTVNMGHEMMKLTLGVATLAFFGIQVNDLDGDLAEEINVIMRDTVYRFEHPFYPPLWFPAGRNLKLKKAVRRIDDIIYGLINARRAQPSGRQDALDILMAATLDDNEAQGDGSRGMSIQQLRDEMVTLFLAGHETTAANLCWTLYLLTLHPEVETRLRRELDEVLGGRAPTLQDLPRLEYTRMVRDESLRLYPPVWLTERLVLRDDVLGGYHIPAGTTLAITQYVTHRHPAFWDSPEVFDPERFRPERMRERHEYAYIPFSGGKRQCLGRSMALLESHLALPMLLQRYRFELEPGWQVLKEPELSLRLKGGLPMRLKPA